jgi:hypothetical protein
MGLIGNKEKQFAAGNWGHPGKWLKRHTKIQDIPEVSRRKSRKKKRRTKPWVNPRTICPFCKTELKVLKKDSYFNWLDKCEPICRHCGAKIDECPACKRETWRSPNGIYKHQDRMFSCGFIGKKKWRKDNAQ